MDEYGIIPEELERSLQSRVLGGKGVFSSMLYLIPTFHNPTGISLSPGNDYERTIQ